MQILFGEKEIADAAAAALAKGPFELEFQCRAVADECTVMFSELNAVKTDLKHMEATLQERLERNADQEEIDESRNAVAIVTKEVNDKEKELAANKVRLEDLNVQRGGASVPTILRNLIVCLLLHHPQARTSLISTRSLFPSPFHLLAHGM